MSARLRLRRRGLSLVEVLIAVVLLGIVGAGITRLLSSQMRFFSRATNARDARAVSRSALNLVRAEMRMIEPRGIVGATADSVSVRLPYAMGLNCSLNTGTFMPVDSLTYATAVYGGYAWKDTAAAAVYTYVPSVTAPVGGLAASCTGVGITPVPDGPLLTLAAVPTAVAGAPLFLFQTVTYVFDDSVLMPGRTALWRRVTGGAAEEVAVPVDAGSEFRFYVVGSTVAQAAVPSPLTDMTGVELVLQGESERSSPGTGAPESSETRISIFFRNVVQ